MQHQTDDVENLLIQMEQMEKDHFYTSEFEEEHPNKIPNAFYERGTKEDVMNVYLADNEIDGYSEDAENLLAKFI